MDPFPMPAPYGGVDQKTPVIALQSPYCQNLLNFNVNQSGITLRNGDSTYIEIDSLITGTTIFKLVPYGSSKLFLTAKDGSTGKFTILDVDADTIVYTSVASVTTNVVQTLYFNKYLFFFANGSGAPGYSFDGSTTYTTIGYTGSGSFNPLGGDVFNARGYLIQEGEAAYWYTAPQAISGACTKVSLEYQVSEKCTMAISTSFTLADTVQSIRIKTFIFDNGEIIFYSGSYPDSADWTEVGRAKIGPPLNYQSFIIYQGDSLILCDSGVVSLRDLFLKGSDDAINLNVNSRINPKWDELVQAIRASDNAYTGLLSRIRGVWDSKTDRIIVSFGNYIDANGTLQHGSFYFVFFTQLTSWFYQRSFGVSGGAYIKDITRYKNKNIIIPNISGTSKTFALVKEGSTGFMDQAYDGNGPTIGYDYAMISAPISNGRAYVQKIEGLDVILNTDLHAQTSYTLIKDLGVQTTTPQVLTGGVSGSLQKPLVDIGIEGSYVQLQITGTTTSGKTVGYQLYGMNIGTSIGQSPR